MVQVACAALRCTSSCGGGFGFGVPRSKHFSWFRLRALPAAALVPVEGGCFLGFRGEGLGLSGLGFRVTPRRQSASL